MIQLILHHVIPRPEVGGRSAEPWQRGRPREPRVVDGPQSVERPLAHNEEPLQVGTVSPATASSVVLRVYSSIDTSAPTIGVYPGVGTISRDVAIWCDSRRILRVTRHQSEAANETNRSAREGRAILRSFVRHSGRDIGSARWRPEEPSVKSASTFIRRRLAPARPSNFQQVSAENHASAKVALGRFDPAF